ncbi:hypothetical protein HYS48_00995, partial [Candidatus Woesearchaeota archaeon]|nr:hypothetical protein [Candidatus Woesearchaeota archaeon]
AFDGKQSKFVDLVEGIGMKSTGTGFVEVHRKQSYPPVTEAKITVTADQIQAGEIQYQESDGKVWYWRDAQNILNLHAEGTVQIDTYHAGTWKTANGKFSYRGEEGSSMDFHPKGDALETIARGRFFLEEENLRVDTTIYRGTEDEKILFTRVSTDTADLLMIDGPDNSVFAEMAMKFQIGTYSIVGQEFGVLSGKPEIKAKIGKQNGQLTFDVGKLQLLKLAAMIDKNSFLFIEKSIFLNAGQGKGYFGINLEGMGRFEQTAEGEFKAVNIHSPVRIFSSLGGEITLLSQEQNKVLEKLYAALRQGNVQALAAVDFASLQKNPALWEKIEKNLHSLNIDPSLIKNQAYLQNLQQYGRALEERGEAIAQLQFLQAEIQRRQARGEDVASLIAARQEAATAYAAQVMQEVSQDPAFQQKIAYLDGELEKRERLLQIMQQELAATENEAREKELINSIQQQRVEITELEKQQDGLFAQQRDALVEKFIATGIPGLLSDAPEGLVAVRLEPGEVPEGKLAALPPELQSMMKQQAIQQYAAVGRFGEAEKIAKELGDRNTQLIMKAYDQLQKGNPESAIYAFSNVEENTPEGETAQTALAQLQQQYLNTIDTALAAEYEGVWESVDERLAWSNLRNPVKAMGIIFGTREGYVGIADEAAKNLALLGAGVHALNRLADEKGITIFDLQEKFGSQEGFVPLAYAEQIKGYLAEVYSTELAELHAQGLDDKRILNELFVQIERARHNPDVLRLAQASQGLTSPGEFHFQSGEGYADLKGLEKTWKDAVIEFANAEVIVSMGASAVLASGKFAAVLPTFTKYAQFGVLGQRTGFVTESLVELSAGTGIATLAPGAEWFVLSGQFGPVGKALRESLEVGIRKELGQEAAEQLIRKLPKDLNALDGAELTALLAKEGVQNAEGLVLAAQKQV